METFLIRCYLWAREAPWSEESTDQLLEDLASFFAKRGFRNDDEDGNLHSLLVAENADVPDEEAWFQELATDPTVEVVVIPAPREREAEERRARPAASAPTLRGTCDEPGEFFRPPELIGSAAPEHGGTAPMATQNQTTVRVIVKLRDLDTDARTVFEHDVAPPRSVGEERSRLIELVAEHKPEAEIRSFANHVASFVDSEHLVVAYFEEPRAIGKALRELARQHGQRELFPATSEEEAAERCERREPGHAKRPRRELFSGIR